MLIENGTISEKFFGTAFLADELFKNLPPDAAEKLRAITKRQNFEANSSVFTRGQKTNCIYLLREGSAQIVFHDDQPAGFAVKGEIFGLTEALSNLPFEASVKTLTACSFDCIDGDELADFLQKEPEICFKLVRVLGTNLQKLRRFFH